ncbi:MAG: T9SS type A sorting domain-containing protein [Calditrichaeota bacterium]|nr:T9SS type A sorting domain-containing protein [Calditrichota bacterium]
MQNIIFQISISLNLDRINQRRRRKRIFLSISLLGVFLFPYFLQAQQWQPVGLEGQWVHVLAIDPVDANIFYAGCVARDKEGGLYRSTNGGATWESLLNEDVWDFDFNPQNPDIIYVCSGRIFKSIDKGNTWSYADSGTVNAERAAGMFGPLAINPNQPDMLLVSQTYGLTLRTSIMYKTENAGRSWRRLASPPYGASALAVDPFCDNTVYAGDKAADYVAYRSKDFGETWEQWQDVGPHAYHVHDIKIVSIDSVVFHIIARGGAGIYISQDGGKTWEQKNEGLPEGSIITQVCLVDSTFYTSTFEFFDPGKSAVYKSSIDLIDWTPVGSFDAFQLVSIRALLYSEYYNKLFAGTSKGIFCYDLPVSVKIVSKQKPQSFSLKQNYPNPFNNNTVIEYELRIPAQVILDIYDINGKLIKRLVNDRKAIGIYRAIFSSKQLGSGVYFYRLKTDSFSETRKLLLVK